jgi:inorganic triphosphatase YgiF
MSSMERELKLTPLDAALLERLANVTRLGPFEVAGRRREKQVNSFYDTRTDALRRARIGFRRRVIDRRPNATWTIKGPSTNARGIASRAEIELELSRLMAPALALEALRQAARERGATVLADQVDDALSDGSLPLPKAYLDMETDRWVLELADAAAGARAELALDTVSIIGAPHYEDIEIEVELFLGEESALDEARAAIEALGAVRESDGSKLSRALDYIERSAPSSR